MSRANLVLVSLCLSLALPGPARAWGPHTEITAAALAVLPRREALKEYLGEDWGRLARDYCWMADWKEAVRPDHYADDYLLFPAVPDHPSHMLPEVRRTYEPFFRRALQAVRTEEPREAARWAGSLLHFVQDSGSPPHTAGIGGSLHGKMERWVDEAKVKIPGYAPRLLGRTEAEALRGFEARMDRLAAYSKVRALKLKPILEKLERRENQPLELESALETARVSADVLHTLFTLGLEEPAARGGVLEGKLDYRPPAGYARVPAKVILAATDFSTTTDAEGRYRFRNLPPGKYTVWFQATGYEVAKAEGVEVKAGEVVELSPVLKPDRVVGNLVRNPRFALSWVKPGVPDGWVRDPMKPGRWASAVIRVPLGRRCRAAMTFREGGSAVVAVRWRSNPSSTAGSRVVALEGGRGEVSPPGLMEPFEKGVLFLEVLVEAPEGPAAVCEHVAVTFAGKGGE